MMRSGKERYSDGNVPYVNWNGNYGKLNVNRCNTGYSNSNIRSREEVSPNTTSTQIEVVRYLIQPLVILDNSCRLDSSSRYLLLGIIFNSLDNLINFLSNSILILVLLRVGNLEVFCSKDALIISCTVSRQIFSIFE